MDIFFLKRTVKFLNEKTWLKIMSLEANAQGAGDRQQLRFHSDPSQLYFQYHHRVRRGSDFTHDSAYLDSGHGHLWPLGMSRVPRVWSPLFPGWVSANALLEKEAAGKPQKPFEKPTTFPRFWVEGSFDIAAPSIFVNFSVLKLFDNSKNQFSVFFTGRFRVLQVVSLLRFPFPPTLKRAPFSSHETLKGLLCVLSSVVFFVFFCCVVMHLSLGVLCSSLLQGRPSDKLSNPISPGLNPW